MGALLSRRRYMGGGGGAPTDYIRNGLVFHLDGIDKGENEGYWTDLVGGCKYSLPASGVTSIANGVEFTSMVTMPLVNGTVPNGTDKTIEVVVFKKSGSGTPAGVFQVNTVATSGDIAVYFNDNHKNVFMQRRKCVYESPALNVLSRYSYNLDVCCVNEVQGTFSDSDYWSVQTPGVGSGYKNTRGMIGIIHSIRIYDRKLSLNEMIANQKYDLIRFGT